MRFYEAKFLEDVQKIHLKPDELPIYSAIQDSKVREKLNDFIDYGANPRFAKSLDKICANLVGRTMFKLLITKMIARGLLKRKGKVRIVEQDDKRKGSEYYELAVKINFDFYDEHDIGIPDRQYYCLNERSEIETKLKSMTGSMFHEFCHCLHDVSGTNTFRDTTKCDSEKITPVWDFDEELRTITCFNHDPICDPICDHCFDLYQSILKGETFRPRYAHSIGYRSSITPTEDKLRRALLTKHLPLSQKYMDGWREYMI